MKILTTGLAGTGTSRRGSTLLLCIVLIVPMLILGMALMRQGVGQQSELEGGTDQERAELLAEAGLAEAVTSLRAGGNGNIGDRAAPVGLGAGLLWVEATPLSDRQLRLLSVGLSGSGRAAVEMVVQLQVESWRTFSIFSNLAADLKGDFFLDSYDSRLGDYASQVPGGSDHAHAKGKIGSNADIDIGKKSTVYGDLKPGPTGTAITGGSTVSGSTTPATTTVSLPPVTPPALLGGGALVVSGTVTLPPGDHRFSSISVSNGSELVVPGPSRLVVDGAVDIAPHAKIQVAASGAVELYVGGDVSMGTKAGIETPSGSALDFTVLLTGASGQNADFQPHGDFYGSIYGPGAEIVLGNDFVLFGAACGAEVTCQNPKVRVHWDEALADGAVTGAPQIAVLYWHPAPLPDDELARDRRDPYRVLGLERGSLPSPAAGWDMSGFPPGF
jgi:hypothetical protein